MLTQTQYADFKKEAIAKQPHRKTINLRDLRFITMDAVEYAGLTLGINRQGLKDIVRIIGFSVSGQDKMNSQVGEETSINILNALKNTISGTSMEVTISVTPDRVITRVVPAGSKSSLISATTYFDTFERMANQHNLNIQSTNFNPSTGSIFISALADGKEHQIGNFKDEIFSTGISFSRTDEGIQADPYMHRLVCTNGMVTRQFEESFKLRTMEPKMWEEFYTHLDKIEKSNFVPGDFNNAVQRSMNTPASLLELESACSLLTSNSKIPEGELEIFFRGLKNTYNKFHQAGIDTIKLTFDQKKNCRSGVKHWDLINGITDFASHNYGYEKSANADRHLQVRAGDLLAKGPECQNLILNQPF
jgi:hypothetical protein